MEKVYDPNQLSVVFGGSPISGFAEDTMLEIEHEDQLFKFKSDVHGNVSRTKINKDLTKITLTLTRDSYSNNTLNSFVEMDRLTNGGVFPIIIKDPNGVTMFACTHACVSSRPKISYGGDEKNREWTIQASGITQHIGN